MSATAGERRERGPEAGNRALLDEGTRRLVVGGAIGFTGVGLLGLLGWWYSSQSHGLNDLTRRDVRRKLAKFNSIGELAQAPPPLPVPPVVHQVAQPTRTAPPPIQNFAQQTTAPTSSLGGSFWPRASDQSIEPTVPAPRPLERPVSDEDEKKAASKVYMARKLEKEGKVRLATKYYQEVLDKYPGTDAAEEAQRRIGYAMDKRVERAAKLLSLAQGFEISQSVDEARAQYEEIVSFYPETEQANTARERLEALKK
jgi:hypothetical protein